LEDTVDGPGGKPTHLNRLIPRPLRSAPGMATFASSARPIQPLFRLLRRRWVAGVASVPLIIAGLSWWLTADLEPAGAPSSDPFAPLPISAKAVAPRTLPSWPDARLEGDPAKQYLLDVMLADEARLEAVAGYTATLRRRERLGGKLGDEQILQMK